MSFSATVGYTFATSEGVLSYGRAISADTKIVQSLTVPDESSNLEVPVAIPVAGLKGIVVGSNRDVTLKFNDSGFPDPEIALKAGVPYIWFEDSYDDCKFENDITKVYITNASGANAVVSIRAMVEATEYA